MQRQRLLQCVTRICRRRVVSLCDSKTSTSPATQRHRTTVLLLHDGQPRTPFYAKNFLAQSAHRYYKLPLRLTTLLVDSLWPFSKKVQLCVSDYEYSEVLQETVERNAKRLESTLNQLLPEFGVFTCQFAFHYDEPSVESQIEHLISVGTERLVLLPLYAHYSCFQSGSLLNSAVQAVCERTAPLRDTSGEVPSARAAAMSPVSFAVSAVDRWSAHPTLANYWYQLIRNRLKDYDSILFVAPQMRGYGSREYSREVWSTCERVAERTGNSLAWRLAWYGSWDQWPASSADCIRAQLFFLRRERKERTLAVPVTSLFPNFDTDTLLPHLLINIGVELASPASVSPVLIHGLAEILKNHLLKGRLATAQLSTRCRLCIDPRCSLMKRVLSRNCHIPRNILPLTSNAADVNSDRTSHSSPIRTAA